MLFLDCFQLRIMTARMMMKMKVRTPFTKFETAAELGHKVPTVPQMWLWRTVSSMEITVTSENQKGTQELT